MAVAVTMWKLPDTLVDIKMKRSYETSKNHISRIRAHFIRLSFFPIQLICWDVGGLHDNPQTIQNKMEKMCDKNEAEQQPITLFSIIYFVSTLHQHQNENTTKKTIFSSFINKVFFCSLPM